MKTILAAAAVVLLFASSPLLAWADYHEGVSGYGGDIEAALRAWRPMAEQGHAGAQTQLGLSYLKGRGVQQDYVEAERWLRRAAQQNDFMAQFVLGFMYHYGQGLPQDDGQALNWYKKSAEQGFPDAQEFLGSLYYQGLEVVEQDYGKAAQWFRRAADQGQPDAQLQLANMYSAGHGVPKDLVQAYKWYSIAALPSQPQHIRQSAEELRDQIAKSMTYFERLDGWSQAGEWLAKFKPWRATP